ncbi:hypothetical protein [Virgibacillus sp. 6R]|uniref:hypothetical protein n=1 Tax=Metabacillus sp. 22489 TaxID=3453928 RepID=UPI0011A67119
MEHVESTSYLLPLIGRKVRVFKGGPESKEGILLNVNADFLTLVTEENEIIYYQTMHSKTIVEDTRSQSQLSVNKKIKNKALKDKSFNSLLRQMVTKQVQINRGGPESLIGILVNLHEDFLTLQTENEGIIFFQIHHIKSISIVESEDSSNNKKEGSSSSTTSKKSSTNSSNKKKEEANSSVKALTFDVPIISAQYFKDLLNQYKHRWVTINRGGPESVEGVLAEVTNDYTTVIHHEKVFRIANYHIHNVSNTSKHDKNKQENSKKDDTNKSDNKEQSNSTDSKDNNQSNQKNNGDTQNKNNNKDSSEKEKNNKNNSKQNDRNGKSKDQNDKNKEKNGKDNKGKSSSKDNKNNSDKKTALYYLLMNSLNQNLTDSINIKKNSL